MSQNSAAVPWESQVRVILYILVPLEKFLVNEMGLEEHTASIEVHCR